MIRRVLAVAAAIVAAAVARAATAEAAKSPTGKLKISTLSTKPQLVTGGDVLVAVDVSGGAKPAKVKVRLNGADVTADFAPRAGQPESARRAGRRIGRRRQPAHLLRPRGQEAGEADASSTARSPARSSPGRTSLRSSAGPRTPGSGRRPTPTARPATTVAYYYRTDEQLLQAARRPDRARIRPTASRRRPATGVTVDYVVRLETGVIDRSIYRFAILAPGGRMADGWNKRFVFNFGGGCSAGHEQGSRGVGHGTDQSRALRGLRDADRHPQRLRHGLQRRALGRERADAQGARDRGARRDPRVDDGAGRFRRLGPAADDRPELPGNPRRDHARRQLRRRLLARLPRLPPAPELLRDAGRDVAHGRTADGDHRAWPTRTGARRSRRVPTSCAPARGATRRRSHRLRSSTRSRTPAGSAAPSGTA